MLKHNFCQVSLRHGLQNKGAYKENYLGTSVTDLTFLYVESTEKNRTSDKLSCFSLCTIIIWFYLFKTVVDCTYLPEVFHWLCHITPENKCKFTKVVRKQEWEGGEQHFIYFNISLHWNKLISYWPEKRWFKQTDKTKQRYFSVMFFSK